MRVVVTGVSGRLGRLLAEELAAAGHEVLGIDRRAWPDAGEGIEVFQTDLRKRPAEDVFRMRRPEALVHMATAAHLHLPERQRHQMSLGAIKAAIDYCQRYGVRQAVFVGRHTYYGATPDAPLYHSEDEPPVTTEEFPELSDLVAADLYAGSALWRYPTMDTAVLRLCYTLGPSRHGTLADFLKGPKVPTVMGFDPLFQFMHERDAVAAVKGALHHGLRGVFNVSGPTPLPLSTIISETGRESIPIPEPLYGFMLGKFGLPWLPRAAINHVKFPIVVDSSPFRQQVGFAHQYDEYDTMAAFREADISPEQTGADAQGADLSESAEPAVPARPTKEGELQ